MGSLGPVTLYGVLLASAGILLYLAFRRKGILPPNACLCGYSTDGNDTGICPECGQSLGDTLDKAEWKRLKAASRRVMYTIFGLACLFMPILGIVIRLNGERVYSDCRTLLAPLDTSYARAELTWRVRRDAPGKSNAVEVALKSSGGVTSQRTFTPSTQPGKVRDSVIEWASSVGVNPAASDGATLRELGEAVEAATQGREVLLVGGQGASHALLASGSVVTYEASRWPAIVALAGWVLVCVPVALSAWRRAMGGLPPFQRRHAATPAG
jgi:hypothetical protein